MIELDPVETFRQEAGELLDSLESALLDLGSTPHDKDLVDTAFRALHTLKGSGSMFGFDRVATFTHDFETAFDLIRKGEIEPNGDIVSVSLAAKDHIRALIEDPVSTDQAIGNSILDDLRRYLGPPTSPFGWSIRVAFDPDILRNGTNPLALLDDLRGLGTCRVLPDLSNIPELDALDPASCLFAWDVKLDSACSRTEIEDVFVFVRDEMTLALTRPGDASQIPATPADTPPKTGSRNAASPRPAELPPASTSQVERSEPRRADDKSATVRVQAERLDELMDRVGELVIAQARLSQLANAGSDLAIKSVAEEVERLASGLRDSTMGVRMVPMGSLFGRFRRLVHDLSRDLQKPVDFVTTGEDTELDKTMIERLADPLVHLIRNAIDHGIEPPEARAGTGKAATGRIELSARYLGAQVLVEVRDDGSGLDAARIRAKAEEQGLVLPGGAITEQEIFQLLFHPGFSTARTVSALSGRGVGMDVVKRTIEAMRGSIDLSTKPGHGSTVTLRLPLTLAIIEGLLVRVGAGRYIIPLSTIEECIELDGSSAQSRSRSFLNVRGDLVPFLRLRDLFLAEGDADPHQKVIITSIGDIRVGLVVDQIVGSHQTVIKSLSKLHADVVMFSGATILGDGSAALILDVAQLVALSQSSSEGTAWGGGCLMPGNTRAATGQAESMQALMLGLGDEIFAIKAGIVREILDPVPMTRVAGARNFVPSLINVRGNVIPLADIRVRFGMPRQNDTPDTRIVVIEVEIENDPVILGIVADKVYEVAEICGSQKQQTPRLAMRWRPEFIGFITKWKDEFVIVPDLEKILT